MERLRIPWAAVYRCTSPAARGWVRLPWGEAAILVLTDAEQAELRRDRLLVRPMLCTKYGPEMTQDAHARNIAVLLE